MEPDIYALRNESLWKQSYRITHHIIKEGFSHTVLPITLSKNVFTFILKLKIMQISGKHKIHNGKVR